MQLNKFNYYLFIDDFAPEYEKNSDRKSRGSLSDSCGGHCGDKLYMLDYTLAPEPERGDTARWFRELYAKVPETRAWVDSLKRREALRDTFVVMPTGERHHAYYVNRGGQKTAVF